MILGRGTAQTPEEIITEHLQFMAEYRHLTPVALTRLRTDVQALQDRLGPSPSDWREEDILALYQRPRKDVWPQWTSFITFLLFRGYRRATCHFLTTLPCHYPRVHAPALQSIRYSDE